MSNDPQFPSTPRHLKVGIIGVGGMGAFHARTLASFAHVEVVAVADPDMSAGQAIAAEIGCAASTDPDDLASSTTLDGLVIASPDATHAALALRALANETMTLCEKPLATSAAEAQMVVDAEIGIGRRLVQLGFMREYDPAHRQLLAELPSLGQIDYLRTTHRNCNEHPRPIEQMVGQSLVHDIHSVRFLTGSEITAVTAHGSRPDDGSFRHVLAVCELATGAHAALEFDDCGFGYEVSVEILARDGDVVTGGPLRAVRRSDGLQTRDIGRDWFGWFAEAYRIQDQAWVDSLQLGESVGPSLWDGLAAQRVVEATLRSLATGRTESVLMGDPPPLYSVTRSA